MHQNLKMSLVIPCYNEEEGVREVIGRCPREIDEIVVVDNNSTDRTAEVARSLGAVVVSDRKPGYGAAYKAGLRAATGDVVVTLEGDGTYPPEAVPGAGDTQAQQPRAAGAQLHEPVRELGARGHRHGALLAAHPRQPVRHVGVQACAPRPPAGHVGRHAVQPGDQARGHPARVPLRREAHRVWCAYRRGQAAEMARRLAEPVVPVPKTVRAALAAAGRVTTSCAGSRRSIIPRCSPPSAHMTS